MERRQKGRRTGKARDHVCPKCSATFPSLRKFRKHIDSHFPSDAPSPSVALQRIEAILLGLASSALWEFVEWGVRNVDVEKVEQVFRLLFDLARPMGGGRLSVQKILSMYVAAPARRPEAEQSLEDGLHQLDNYQRWEEIVRDVDETVDTWIIAMNEKEDLSGREPETEGP